MSLSEQSPYETLLTEQDIQIANQKFIALTKLALLAAVDGDKKTQQTYQEAATSVSAGLSDDLRLDKDALDLQIVQMIASEALRIKDNQPKRIRFFRKLF